MDWLLPTPSTRADVDIAIGGDGAGSDGGLDIKAAGCTEGVDAGLTGVVVVVT